MGRIVMGYWDCHYCDTKGIAGSKKDCPNCGHPRDKSTKFYVTKDTAKVVDEDTAIKVKARGKDWNCLSCGSLNPGDIYECFFCGAPRENETNVEQQSNIIDEYEHIDNSEIVDKSEHISELSSKLTEPPIKQLHKFNFPKLPWKKIGIVAIALLLCAVVAFLFIPYDKQVEIVEMSWSRSISIEEYRTVQESDWIIPANGRLQYTQQEIHHYDEVIDHYETKSREVIDHYEEEVVGYEDLGNGYFEEITSQKPVYKTEYYEEPVYRQEPVYATKYYYEIERWRYKRSVDTNGNDKSPYWGEVNLNNKERESSRNSNYYVTTDDKSTYNLSENDWNNLNCGDKVVLSVNRAGFAEVKDFKTTS